MHPDIDLAIVGGTGLYRLALLEDVASHEDVTPFGPISGPVRVGSLAGRRVAFLARHGEAHSLPPHRVNYRANMWMLHALGARRVLAVNAVGGITPRMGPKVLALPDQLIDYTHGRDGSYCDVPGAKVEHVDFSDPYSARLRAEVLEAARREQVDVIDGGVYGCTQGPRLETRAEIARMRQDGCDLVGMTGMPEAVLARELGVEYASLCLVANWAAGCDPSAHEITMEEVFSNLETATAAVPTIVRALLS